MKNKHNKKAVPTIDDNKDLGEDRNILETLYEIGEKVATYIFSFAPEVYPLEKEDGWTAFEIRNKYGRSWGMKGDAYKRDFTINVGSFNCKATYDSIFALIYEFEKINKIKPKSRRKYILGQNKNNKTTL